MLNVCLHRCHTTEHPDRGNQLRGYKAALREERMLFEIHFLLTVPSLIQIIQAILKVPVLVPVIFILFSCDTCLFDNVFLYLIPAFGVFNSKKDILQIPLHVVYYIH